MCQTNCLSLLISSLTCDATYVVVKPPGNTAQTVLESALLFARSSALQALADEEKTYLEQKLYDGYFSFEASTERDWNNSICGICGAAPVFESGDGNAKNCTSLKRGQVS